VQQLHDSGSHCDALLRDITKQMELRRRHLIGQRSVLTSLPQAHHIMQVLALIRALNLVLKIVPLSIKLAVLVGMGLLLAFVGLQVREVALLRGDVHFCSLIRRSSGRRMRLTTCGMSQQCSTESSCTDICPTPPPQTANIVEADAEAIVKLGNLVSHEAILAMLSLLLIATLHMRGVPGGIIIGVFATALG
jgi:xanthine/uracil/vitamin C permease (AzgA family)